LKTSLAAIAWCICAASAPLAFAQTGKPYVLKQKPQDEKLASDPNLGNVTAADLAKACGEYFMPHFYNRERMARKNVCNGYFYGALSALFWLRREDVPSLPYCAPESLSAEDSIKIFLEWSKKTPQPERFIAIEGVLDALDERFPCRTGGETATPAPLLDKKTP